ncbi:MAG: transglutaminase family protein [Rhodospirillaceae bacterium]|nr:transglutaminase family protein [Rhodospirillaceae bacterium]
MHLRIESATTYAYDRPPRHSTQYLRLTPQSGPGQTVGRWDISAPGALTAWNDMFGNRCHTLSVERPGPALEIAVAGTVETRDTAGILPPSPADALPDAVYLRDTGYTGADHGIADFAEPWRDACRADRLAGLHELMTAIHAEIAYVEGATSVLTTAGEAFAERRGVCQDHAHILIAAARSLGIPARYVSGYLWTGETGETGAGGAAFSASHAWAECRIEELGWVSFDPANGVCANDAYVRVAVGFDYATACPVRGVRTGGGGERMTTEIRLFREDEPAILQAEREA